MKKTINVLFTFTVFSILIFYSEFLMAKAVNKVNAQKVARAFLAKRQILMSNALKKPTSFEISMIKDLIDPETNTPLAYIVNLEPKGFIVLSTDTDIEPVIAYSFRSNWSNDTGPANLLYYIIKKRIKYYKKNIRNISRKRIIKNRIQWSVALNNKPQSSTEYFHQWPPDWSTSTGGWVETAWHQHSPYNNFCPIDPRSGNRSMTGCTATAIAQIINFHKYVHNIVFDQKDSYSSNGIQIDADSTTYDFPSFNRLNQLLKTVQQKYDNNDTLDYNDIAAINFACAIGLRSNFSSTGTWHFSGEEHTLLEKFHYFYADYRNATGDFFNILRMNMMNGFPATLDISKVGAASGHTIIVDGYNTDGFYHVNFGQAAGSLAWMRMPEDFPPAYNVIDGGVINIIPTKESFRRLIGTDVTRLSIGGSHIGGSYKIKSFKLTNINANESVTVSVHTATSAFKFGRTENSFSDVIEGFNVDPGKAVPIYIQFLPDSVGYFSGEIIIEASTQDKTQYVPIDLVGYGVPTDATIIDEGRIYGHWSRDHSPYYICGDIQIEDLHIDPGVVIKIFDCEICVPYWAQLKAIGNKIEPITFTAADTTLGWKGILISSSRSQLSFCRITHSNEYSIPFYSNSAVSISNCSPQITHNIIYKNRNGIFISQNASPIISNNTIINNKEIGINFLGVSSDSCMVSNNIIANNGLYGICCDRSSPQIMNNTIVNNGKPNDLKSGGIFCYEGSSPSIKNNIVWGNGADSSKQIILYETSIHPYINYNDIQGGIDGVSVPEGFSADFCNGNINCYPQFLSPTTGSGSSFDASYADWHLSIGSPCIDRGDPNDAIGEEPFPHGFRVNLGAYGGTTGAQITTGPSLAITPNPIDFGGVSTNHQTQKSFYLMNGGEYDIKVISVGLSQAINFSVTNFVSNPQYNKILTPGAIDSLKLILTPIPNVSKTYNDTIIVSTDSLGELRIPVLAQGYIGTIINQSLVSGTWTIEDSPFQILCNINIPQGKSLILKPGVEVIFTGQFKLTIGEHAKFIAKGTKEENICFIPSDTSIGWRGIEFICSEDDDTLKYCTIKYAKYLYANPGAGAIYCNESSPAILNCILSGNTAANGGAIYCEDNSVPFILNNIISNNTADIGGGGGIYCKNATPTIIGNIIVNNSSKINGGGISMDYCKNSIIINNIVCNNNVNSPMGYGGGISIWGRSALIKNTIIWGNEARSHGAQIALGWDEGTDILFSNIQGELDSIGIFPFGSAFSGDYRDNLNSNPVFINPSLGAGANYDGLSADWHLQSNSPCIDSGDPNPIYNDPEDPVNPGYALWPAMGTLRNDMGAYGGGVFSSINYEFAATDWYLISIPVYLQDYTLRSVFPDPTNAFTWNNKNGQYDSVTKLDSVNGFWLATSTRISKKLPGYLVRSYEKYYNAGWQLIGSLGQPVSTAAISTDPPNSALAVFGWDAVNHKYKEVTQLIPGQGYWLALAQDCQVTVSVANQYKPLAKVVKTNLTDSFISSYGAAPLLPPTDFINKQLLPKQYALLQNFPNPFNPETIIKYQLPEPSHVKLEIYNMLGQKVITLVDSKQPAGFYQLRWNGINVNGNRVSTGIYFYKLQTRKFQAIKKMIFIR